MKRWHLTDSYKPNPFVLAKTDEGDGIERVAIEDFGTVFQQVSVRLLRSMNVFGQRVFDSHFRTLNRYDASTRTHWYIRRGKRYFPHWIWWQISSAREWLEVNTLVVLFRIAHRVRKGDELCGSEMSWQRLIDYVRRGSVVS